jgi:hypothetical protein
MDSPSITARPDVAVATTAPRVTPTPPRTNFKEVLTSSLVRGAEAAMRVLPGSPLMAVAVRGGAGPTAGASSIGIPMTGTATRGLSLSPEGPGGGAIGSSLGVAGANALAGGATGTGTTGGPADGSVEASLAQSQEQNLYYLQIQEQVNAQNRSFTTLSNVLKAEHETVKTAIGNIR